MKINVGVIFFFGALGGLLIGFDTGVISGVSPLVETQFSLDAQMLGFITAAVLVGSAIGALTIGSLSDKFGRKKVMLICAIIFLIATFACSASIGPITLALSRIALGLGVGGVVALSPAYLAELAPKAQRGAVGTLFQLMITFGILLAYVANLSFLGHNIAGIQDWRWMLGAALLPAALLFLGSILLPESPRYLIQNGDTEGGRAVLNHLRAKYQENVDTEINEILEIANEPKGNLKDLLRIAKPALIAGIGLTMFQQFVGINSVIYFLPQVFIKGFNFNEANAIWISVGIGIVNFAVTILATFTMDKFDRKKFLLLGAIIMAVSLSILVILNYTLEISQAAVPTMVLIAFYIFGFAISWGPVVWVMMGEMFPLSVRGVGASIGTACNYVANFIVTFTFPILLTNVFHDNIGGPFAIFAVFSVISIFFVKKFVPETRGKSLEEIEHELRNTK